MEDCYGIFGFCFCCGVFSRYVNFCYIFVGVFLVLVFDLIIYNLVNCEIKKLYYWIFFFLVEIKISIVIFGMNNVNIIKLSKKFRILFLELVYGLIIEEVYELVIILS